MLIRIFEGSRWASARLIGDFKFEALPSPGHKLAIASESGWSTTVVGEIVHRIVDPGDPADIAVLVAAMTTTGDQSELPVTQLDQSGAPAAPAASLRPSPWR